MSDEIQLLLDVANEYGQVNVTVDEIKQIRADAIDEFDKALRTNTLMPNWCYQLVRSVKKDLLKEQTETWHGYHNDLEMPKGTFERIFNDCEENDDDV